MWSGGNEPAVGKPHEQARTIPKDLVDEPAGYREAPSLTRMSFAPVAYR